MHNLRTAIEMKGEELPGWFPHSVYIASYQIDPEKETQDAVEKLFNRYRGTYSKESNSLEFRAGSVSGYAKGLSEKGSQVFLLAVGSAETERKALDSIPSYEPYDELVEDMKEALPENSDSTYSLRLAYSTDEKEAGALLRCYVRNTGRTLKSAGFVRGSILATLGGPRDLSSPMASRELMTVSIGDGLGKGADAVWTLCFEICCLAIYTGQMNRLHSQRELMFDQTDAAERSTQLWINEILAKMRRPIEEIQPKDLEEILKETTIQFSRLSTMASSMRRDYVKAQGLLRGMRALLKKWNERPMDDSITNSSAEMDDLENLMTPFRDFTERTEALMTQLSTVLDSVRTYLGIQQQKMSIMEQTSSKEQLVRLVNLQEILHKLEVLIVAVYLTEMARIVFETLLHESANLATTAFIPVALLTSVFISRILHEKH